MELYKGDDIVSDMDIYRLMVQPKLEASVSIDEFFEAFGITCLIDKTFAINKLGKKKSYTVKEITKFLWRNSNFGDNDICMVDHMEKIEWKKSDMNLCLQPAYLFFKIDPRNVRRKIKKCEFFAIRFHRWYALTIKNPV
ncbi:MAG: hypothetical protein OMM_12716 [Candidatus Magnetoglobus multicellularis str. Araruama]|uniref:Uncharacterized protein n=1 Tax=Candidatus Magnetoglobus multicellularis str. Araruama TaxID=890399 RepID=A0A1V1NVB6_9BACT|nr:MAG: hypothetical protein OMM_12716 [Candidatus Magnetoglobus multicellularis str. Araruama]